VSIITHAVYIRNPGHNFFRSFDYFRLFEGSTTNQTPENDRIGPLCRDDPVQNFLFYETSRPALESTQSSEWVSGAFYPGIKQSGYEADLGPNKYEGLE